ncbi:MAG: hypothetical protein LBL04_10205, partial [Bacteroidales bacterium]|nr:hypothetical protein [Bacteroidales bacterium]
MKRAVLMLLPALAFFGCISSKTDTDPLNENTAGKLYVIGNAAGTVKSGTVRAAEQTDRLVFTGDDIVSFEVWKGQIGGQIRFTEEKLNEIVTRVELYSELHFLIDDRPVFDPPIRIYRGWDFSFSDADFDLQFRYDGSNVFLTDAYMALDSIASGDKEAKRKEMEANRQKRQQELDVFIKYLKDAGKLVNETVFDIPGIDPQPSDSICNVVPDGGDNTMLSEVPNTLPACTTRIGDVLHYLTDHKTTILKEYSQDRSLSSHIVIAKLFDDTEPTAYLTVEHFSTYRICNYP